MLFYCIIIYEVDSMLKSLISYISKFLNYTKTHMPWYNLYDTGADGVLISTVLWYNKPQKNWISIQ